MAFFEIKPRNTDCLNKGIDYIRLRVTSIEVTPNTDIVVTDLQNGYKHFYNTNKKGITFQVSVILDKTMEANGYKVINILDYCIQNMIPVTVRSEAIDIPELEDGLYLITKNSSRKQEHVNYTTWDLEFTTFIELKQVQYKNDNTRVKNAIKSAKAKKVAAKKTKSKSKSTKKSKFAKCKVSVLKYSKKKKVVKCVKYMQEILKKQKSYTGKVDGWYGPMTVTAVKKFQKKYKKKYSLKVTGKVDTKTFNALKKV